MQHYCCDLTRLRPFITQFSNHEKWKTWCCVFLGGVVLSGVFSAFAPFCDASPYVPVDGRADILYRLTHLPIGAYFVMLLVVVLAAANLFYQSRSSQSPVSFPGFRRGPGSEGAARSMRSKNVPAAVRPRGPQPNASAPNTRIIGLDDPASEIVGVRRVVDEPETLAPSFPCPPDHAPRAGISRSNDLATAGRHVEDDQRGDRGQAPLDGATPLDGVDHPLPDLTMPARPDPPGIPRPAPPRTAAVIPTAFKFTSAVEMPSREEVQRREREKLVVAGSVRQPDGSALASVLVYLTDANGHRVGQSARSRDDTGDFKVIANEPGRYELKAYKRGFVVESNEPMVLPIESGRIEGYIFRMAPEGCAVHGKIVDYRPDMVGPALFVRCVEEGERISRAAAVDSSGAFKIEDVQPNSECILEVVDPKGTVIARTLPFSTRDKKELSQEIRIPVLHDKKVEHDVMWSESVSKKDKPSETPRPG